MPLDTSMPADTSGFSRSETSARKKSPMSVHATARLNSELNLINQARNGDANAFAVLYETHKPRIQAVCLRMTNNVTEAEDLAQDAFIYVFRKISAFRGDSAFSTWIHRVTVNTVLMHFRRKGKRHVSLDHPHPQESDRPKPEYGRVDERLAACADRLALVRAIKELPLGYRTIFILHQVKGYEHQEIARRLHCSIGNSKSQLHKAKLRLREQLAPQGYTFRQRVAAAKPQAVRAPALMAAAKLSLVQPSTDASPGPGARLPGGDRTGRKDCVLRQPNDVAASAFQKQLSRRESLADLSVVGNPEVMLPAMRRVGPGLMAESGS
jgi:RNA polymerase sigma-70 factor (ECF subfamily)